MALALAPCLQAGEIYRCNNGQTLVFSDRPCADDAQLHRTSGSLSVVAAAEGLDDIAERNRTFVDQRREQLEQQRRAAAERSARQTRRTNTDNRPRTYPVRHFIPIADAGDRDSARRDRATDPRTRARRDTPTAAPSRDRSTLLSRSGGGGRRILR